jgi:hypothetical protein
LTTFDAFRRQGLGAARLLSNVETRRHARRCDLRRHDIGLRESMRLVSLTPLHDRPSALYGRGGGVRWHVRRTRHGARAFTSAWWARSTAQRAPFPLISCARTDGVTAVILVRFGGRPGMRLVVEARAVVSSLKFGI